MMGPESQKNVRQPINDQWGKEKGRNEGGKEETFNSANRTNIGLVHIFPL